MKKRKFSMLLVLAGLLLALSGCGKPQPAEMQQSAETQDSRSSAAVDGEAVTADLELEGDRTAAELFGKTSDGEAQGESSAGGMQYEAGAGQGSTDTIHETGQNPQQPTRLSTETPEVTEELEIHFLDVGQGDCTLLLCGGEAMLIDAGDNNQGTRIQNYLQKCNVETLKYVVCTHPDEDHIGGMDVILYKFDCETILMTDEEKDTNTYRDVVDTMENRGYQRTLPSVGQQYSLGDAVFTILAPSELSSDSNNNSIALLLVHGDNRFLFTGDAEEEEEEEMVAGGIALDADVYKAGHHGSRTSSSEKLLEAVSPAYVVISCGEGNSYGHPHAETMNHLRTMGVQVFRTDEQGSIVLSSDGSEIRWNCSPSDTWQAGEPTGSSGERPSEGESGPAGERQPEGTAGSSGTEQSGRQQPGEPGSAAGMASATAPAVTEAPEEAPAPETASYICNTNTKKFHYPDCSSVKQMKEENKLPVNTTRDELINQGYDPCRKCNP